MTSAIQGTHARIEGKSRVETQTHATLTARAPTATPAPALTLHAGPGTGLALSLKARKVGAVPDKTHSNGDEAARAQRTMQTGLRRRDA